MFLKISILILILMSLTLQVQSQTTTLPLGFQTGSDPDGDSLFAKVQIGDTLFNTILFETGWQYVKPNVLDTCDCTFPIGKNLQYFGWRVKFSDKLLESAWSPAFKLGTQSINHAPLPGSCVSPANGTIIRK